VFSDDKLSQNLRMTVTDIVYSLQCTYVYLAPILHKPFLWWTQTRLKFVNFIEISYVIWKT